MSVSTITPATASLKKLKAERNRIEGEISKGLAFRKRPLPPEYSELVLKVLLPLFKQSNLLSEEINRRTITNQGSVPTLAIGARSMAELMRLPLAERLRLSDEWNNMHGNPNEHWR